jgi:MerR family transcriptional regulator, thiopeptide resistance regulator
MSFTVGQLAKLTGLTVRTLHHYDAIGLLTPSQRSDAGYRLYVQQDVTRLYRIVALQRFGLPLADIAEALQTDSSALPNMVEQQIAELDEQIAESSRLREQLLLIRQRLRQGAEPSMTEWLELLEFLAVNARHYSAQELEGITTRSHQVKDRSQQLTAQIRTALTNGLSAASDEAFALAKQWVALNLHKAGGDVRLMLKMKDIYHTDPAVRGFLQGYGVTPEMMSFLVDALGHRYRQLWTRHFAPNELDCLDLDTAWLQAWLPVVAQAANAMRSEQPADCSWLQSWDAMLNRFVHGNTQLRTKVLQTVTDNTDLQLLWLVDRNLLAFAERQRQVRH